MLADIPKFANVGQSGALLLHDCLMPKTPENGLHHVIGLSEPVQLPEHEWIASQDYDPNLILDVLIAKMQLESDAALAHKLQVIQPIIRMVREGSLAMSPTMLLLWIEEATGITPAQLRALMAARKIAQG